MRLCAPDVIWNGDRRILYVNPDVLISEPGDLDNMKECAVHSPAYPAPS